MLTQDHRGVTHRRGLGALAVVLMLSSMPVGAAGILIRAPAPIAAMLLIIAALLLALGGVLLSRSAPP